MSNATTIENEKKYELRSLQSKDIFAMTRIISCIGIKEFNGCFASDDVKAVIAAIKNGDKSANVESVGIAVMLNVADVIISNIGKAEQYIYIFLSNLSGMSKKELEELDIITFVEMLMDVFKKDEFKDFFKAASRFAK